jgi:propionate CoA-transferase
LPVQFSRTSKLCSAEEAVARIPDGACITISGTISFLLPRQLIDALEVRFLTSGGPRDLTWFEPFPTGERGIEPLSHPGLLKRVISGFYTVHEQLRQMILDNQVEAYLFPLGSLSFWCQAMAAGRDHYATRVGLETYLDPRVSGGRLNDATKEELVGIESIQGDEYIVYPKLQIDVVLIRGSVVDELGNVSLEHESATMNVLYQAMAAKRSGGRVIVQAARLVQPGQIPARMVSIPGILVDDLVIHPEQEGDDATGVMDFVTPATRVPRPPTRVLTSPDSKVWRKWLLQGVVDDSCPAVRPLSQDVLIARRAVMSLDRGAVINVGAGLPLREIPPVAIEEEIDQEILISIETGQFGGTFNGSGLHVNMTSILDTPAVFSFYASHLIGKAFFSMLEFDEDGNINLLRYGDTWVGPGGSMDIAEAVADITFCGTLRAGGLRAHGQGGLLTIEAEGSVPRAVPSVAGVVFNGSRMREQGKRVTYITERAVFRLTDDGVLLCEVAPGMDVERDVLAHMSFVPKVADDLRTMDVRIFTPGPMGVRDGWPVPPPASSAAPLRGDSQRGGRA